MRIDKYLKVSRLIKRRTLAKEALDQGRVSVNGRVVKASYEVKVGDQIELNLPSGLRTVRVEAVRENVPAKDAPTLYREV
ncbi:MAG: RNA-binding S4 domain-containing protein [Firmicutes bacterium]|jgi:ribosomal 50S subunit-recycling heat shock protein|nr:RNA-binding S4 domain-containing protein [Bacillota bacterium]